MQHNTVREIVNYISNNGFLTTADGEPSTFDGLPQEIREEVFHIYASSDDGGWLLSEVAGYNPDEPLNWEELINRLGASQGCYDIDDEIRARVNR